MKLLLLAFTLSTLVFSIQCRPQNVHPEYRATAEVLKLPFYGGARGQILEIRKNPDGTVISKILQDGNEELKLSVRKVDDDLEDEIIAENDYEEPTTEGFGNYLENIQLAAANLVKLQDNVKKTGRLTSEQKKLYTESLQRLGVAAQNLANFQTGEQDKDDRIQLLFEKEYERRTNPGTKKLTSKVTSFPGFRPAEASKKNQKNKEGEEEEENVGEETDDSTQEETEGTVINAPEKEQSIAEAKPVGLAIAGVGGVASSKPVATAVVGDGGLAVARPVATAIAGIKPSELSGLGIPISASVHKKLLSARGKYGLVHSSEMATAGILIGPDYDPEARATSRIESEEDDTNKRPSFQIYA